MTDADDLTRLFDAERAVRPPREGLERGLSRLLTDVAQHAAPLPIATGSLRLGLSLVSKWLIVGFVVGLGGAGAASQIWASSAAAAPSAAVLPVRGVTVALAAPAAPVASGLAEPAAEAIKAPVHVPGHLASSASAASAVAPPADATTFDEELRLIRAANSELERGHAQLATGWLTEHAQRFPDGVFSVDREALQILVACSRRQQPGLAQAFAANHPKSPMVARLARACTQHARASSSVDFSEIDK